VVIRSLPAGESSINPGKKNAARANGDREKFERESFITLLSPRGKKKRRKTGRSKVIITGLAEANLTHHFKKRLGKMAVNTSIRRAQRFSKAKKEARGTWTIGAAKRLKKQFCDQSRLRARCAKVFNLQGSSFRSSQTKTRAKKTQEKGGFRKVSSPGPRERWRVKLPRSFPRKKRKWRGGERERRQLLWADPPSGRKLWVPEEG